MLNVTQHFEDGYERGEGNPVDLTAAYVTVNHRRLLCKLYEITGDYGLVSVIRAALKSSIPGYSAGEEKQIESTK